MPEMQFQIEWPDGQQELCYSPSLVIKDYLTPGHAYPLSEFVERSHRALTIASDRVQAKYGFACGRALSQRERLLSKAQTYCIQTDCPTAGPATTTAPAPEPVVTVIQFLE